MLCSVSIYIRCACCLCLLAAGMNFGTATVPAINNAPPGTNRLSFCHLAHVFMPAWLFGCFFSFFFSLVFCLLFVLTNDSLFEIPCGFNCASIFLSLVIPQSFARFRGILLFVVCARIIPMTSFFKSFFLTWLPCIYPFFNFILLLCVVRTALNPSSPPVCYSSLCVQGLSYSISDTVHQWVASILLKCCRAHDL